VLTEHAAVDDVADHVLVNDLTDAQLDQTIGEQNARALLDVLCQSLEGGADQLGGARNLTRGDRQPFAFLQQNRLAILQIARADLRALQIAQDADLLVLFAAHLADQAQQCGLFLVHTMREVQAENVDTSANQLAQHRLCVGSRAEGCNNLRAALGG